MTSRDELIRRVERDEVRGLTAYSETFARVHGEEGRGVLRAAGWAVVVLGEGMPINRAIGIGSESAPTVAQIEEAEAFMRGLGVTPRIEVTEATRERLAPMLETRGYSRGQTFMWYVKSTVDPRPAISEVIEIDEAPNADIWVGVTSLGFDDLDHGDASHVNRMLSEATAAGAAQTFLARIGGEAAGGGAMAIHEGHAMLFSTSVLPKFRRRGVQAALLGVRARRARELGCDLMSVKVEPGTKSERNVQRAGFEDLCTKASWKAPEGGLQRPSEGL